MLPPYNGCANVLRALHRYLCLQPAHHCLFPYTRDRYHNTQVELSVPSSVPPCVACFPPHNALTLTAWALVYCNLRDRRPQYSARIFVRSLRLIVLSVSYGVIPTAIPTEIFAWRPRFAASTTTASAKPPALPLRSVSFASKGSLLQGPTFTLGARRCSENGPQPSLCISSILSSQQLMQERRALLLVGKREPQ